MFDKENFNIQETFKLAIKKHLNKNFKEAKKIYSEILKVKPDEIYNFADQDHVGWSYEIPS